MKRVSRIKTLLGALSGSYDAIFILVHGFEFYDRTWEDDTAKFTESMAKVVASFNEKREDGQACTLKVLFTAASYSRSLASSDVPMTKIEMPEDIGRDGDGFEDL
ncbi:hypothetical protein P171DRAFT_480327 [Karstenula rhodostoma CBS 690.94]|uniref:Uncharacterized protein n=1 Tax=Karstenula rhodostoma CBS 690.94 TaxID=1392251 RepID=A0A9P4PTY4_9PLEO|nr:hypothetical protein P171DRAFT_480327 [Karstenula rhodostoma CBS 690.94]